ncbi:hypothetical protein MAPG_05173 [Magnaporthiopsis poae ATCC 64411]|uniref:Heterokaryon incompatibility domain-containing protein n=1 Tax=Magnaporthiopsis poae (strain ATCC 64411 / 73-15) TaxID=644358 RepID=A0A0C4DYP7_MAGP6|nr:hypothetical protein MAPG_05173 [Magnaporthiopsis poae ATCC 64411]
MSTAKEWLADCTCYKSRQGRAWYPTRLLDCGIEGGTESTRLIDTSSNTVDGAYMTLSHCWGDAEGTLKLTTENYAECLCEIPMARLPQLYRDAVYVTRQLGVRYIWIDSICIIQQGDDLADWHREVGLMEHVYSNTFCNISALHAPNSRHSLFSTRNTDFLCPQTIQIAYDGQQTAFLIRDDPYWHDEFEDARLHTRGWVLQERFLSPRVLHFGRSQVFWECTERDISELYGQVRLIYEQRFKSLFHCRPGPSSSRRIDDLYGNWERIIAKFARCRLTYPSDKLVAISAVAKHMSVLLQDEYCAGIWRGNMEQGLEWSVDSVETARRDEVHIDHLIRGFSTGLAKGGRLRLRAAALKTATLVPRGPHSRATPLNSWRPDIDGLESLGDKAFVSVALDAPYEYQALLRGQRPLVRLAAEMGSGPQDVVPAAGLTILATTL